MGIVEKIWDFSVAVSLAKKASHAQSRAQSRGQQPLVVSDVMIGASVLMHSSAHVFWSQVFKGNSNT